MVKNLLTFATLAAICAPVLAQESASVDATKYSSTAVSANGVFCSSDNVSMSAAFDDTYSSNSLTAEKSAYNAISIDGEVYPLGTGIQGSADPKESGAKNPDLTKNVVSGAVFQFKPTQSGYLYVIAKLATGKAHYVYNATGSNFVAYSVAAFTMDEAGTACTYTLPAADESVDIELFTKLDEGIGNVTTAQASYLDNKKIKTVAQCYSAAGGSATLSGYVSGVVAFHVTACSTYYFYAQSSKVVSSGFAFVPDATALASEIKGVKVTTGEPSAIKTISAAQLDDNAPIYNILGQRVQKGHKGICIQNGQKFIVR